MKFRTRLVAGVIICLISLLAACTPPVAQPSPTPTSTPSPTIAATPSVTPPAPTQTLTAPMVFQQWLANGRNIKSMENAYRFHFEADSGAPAPRVTDIEGKAYIKGEKSMDEMKVTNAQGSTVERQYVLGRDLYVASKVEQDWAVKKQSIVCPPGQWDLLKTLQGLLDKGALNFQDVVSERSVAGRAGKEVKMSVVMPKLSQEDRYFLLAQGGMAFLGQQKDVFAAAMKSCEVAMTLVPAEGLELAGDIQLNLDKSLLPKNSPYATKVNITNSDFKVNADVPDDTLALPKAPPTPASSLMTMITGEEDTAEPAIHIVALNVARPETNHIRQTVQGRIDEINAQGGLVIIAHPNARGYTNEEELKALKGYLGMEVYFAWNESALGRWDATLTDRVAKGEPLVWGFMTDDAHQTSAFGKGFTMLRAPEMSQSAVLDALRRGSFYWGEAPLVQDVLLNGSTITIVLNDDATVKFVKQGGVVAKTASGTSANYTVNGDEGYIRMEVESKNGKHAGTQPLRVVSAASITNQYASPGKWFKGNLHTHTTRSDGPLSPGETMKWYEDHGYGFLALTDHASWEIPMASVGSISGQIDYKGAASQTSRGLVYPIALWQASPVSLANITLNGPGSYKYTIPGLPDGTYYGVGAGILSKDASGNMPFKPGDILAIGFNPGQVNISGQKAANNINMSLVDCVGSVSGNITYGGPAIPNQSNVPLYIWVGYQPAPQSPFFKLYFITARPGSYNIPYLPDGKITLQAWFDLDNDRSVDPNEPQFKSQEITMSGGGAVRGVNLALK